MWLRLFPAPEHTPDHFAGTSPSSGERVVLRGCLGRLHGHGLSQARRPNSTPARTPARLGGHLKATDSLFPSDWACQRRAESLRRALRAELLRRALVASAPRRLWLAPRTKVPRSGAASPLAHTSHESAALRRHPQRPRQQPSQAEGPSDLAARTRHRAPPLSTIRLAPHRSVPSPLPHASAAALAASAAFAPPRCAALASPRLALHRSAPTAWRRTAQHHRLRPSRRLPPWRLWRLSRRRAAPRSPRLSLSAAALSTIHWRYTAQHYRLRPARWLPPLRLWRLSCRRAALRSPRLAWCCTARHHPLGAAPRSSIIAFASRVGCRLGGFGGSRAAALRRARIASLSVAPLSAIRLAPHRSAPSPLPRASAAAFAASAAPAPPRCAALASPRLAPHRSAPSPSPCTSAGALTALAALARPRCAARLTSLSSAPLSTSRLAPHRSAPSPSPRASAAALAASAALAPPRYAALASARLALHRSAPSAWRRTAQHHLLRPARWLPPWWLWRPSRRRAAPRSPRLA